MVLRTYDPSLAGRTRFSLRFELARVRVIRARAAVPCSAGAVRRYTRVIISSTFRISDVRVLSRKPKGQCRPPAARVTTPTGVRASLPTLEISEIWDAGKKHEIAIPAGGLAGLGRCARRRGP